MVVVWPLHIPLNDYSYFECHANLNFQIQVRAYTKEGVAMETEWASVAGAAGEEEEEKEKGQDLNLFLPANISVHLKVSM